MPFLETGSQSLDAYVRMHTAPAGWWHNFDKYIVSLLKAWYGGAAARANEWGVGWLARLTGDHSHLGYWLQMADGEIDGLFVMGQNPAGGAPNAGVERRALAKLERLRGRDMVEVETASFWYDSPEIASGALGTSDIATEVFLFPAAGHAEKDGTFTNTQRLLQWHHKAVDPPGDARSDAWFVYHLGRRLKAKAAADRRPRSAPLNALTWDYATSGAPPQPASGQGLRESNSFTPP